MNYLSRHKTWVRCLGQEDPLEVGNSLQYSWQENRMERGAWGAIPWGHKESDMTEVAESARMQSGNSSSYVDKTYCCCSVPQSCLALWDPMDCIHQALLSFTLYRSLLKLMFIDSVMPFNHLVLCWILLLLPSIFSSIRFFPNESVLCIPWLKYWSFRFNSSHFSEHSGMICFRIDWFDLLVVQGNLKSVL